MGLLVVDARELIVAFCGPRVEAAALGALDRAWLATVRRSHVWRHSSFPLPDCANLAAAEEAACKAGRYSESSDWWGAFLQASRQRLAFVQPGMQSQGALDAQGEPGWQLKWTKQADAVRAFGYLTHLDRIRQEPRVLVLGMHCTNRQFRVGFARLREAALASKGQQQHDGSRSGPSLLATLEWEGHNPPSVDDVLPSFTIRGARAIVVLVNSVWFCADDAPFFTLLRQRMHRGAPLLVVADGQAEAHYTPSKMVELLEAGGYAGDPTLWACQGWSSVNRPLPGDCLRWLQARLSRPTAPPSTAALKKASSAAAKEEDV